MRRRILEGSRVAIVGAGPAGCVMATSLLDAARARRRTVLVSLYDGGSGGRREPVLLDGATLGRLASAGLPPPAAASLPLNGVKAMLPGSSATATLPLFTAPRGDLSDGDLGAYLQASAVQRGARLVRRAVDGLSPTADGGWIVRSSGASERTDVVILACGAGSPLAAQVPGHMPPSLWRTCSATLELAEEGRLSLGPWATRIHGLGAGPDLWVVPDGKHAHVLALGAGVGAAELAEALLGAVARGQLPAEFELRAIRRVLLPAGAARPALPTLGDALGGAPGTCGLGLAVAQAQALTAALLDGGDDALLDTTRREARVLERIARERTARQRRWRRVPARAVAKGLTRERAHPPARRPLHRALAESADPTPEVRTLGQRIQAIPALLALIFAWFSLLWDRLASGPALPRPEKVPEVYVVDDDPDQAELVAAFLESRGIPCRSFPDGLAAAAAAARERPAAVVLDVALPWLDGLAVCRALKAQPGTADVPVLVATALPLSLATGEAASAGAEAVLSKPLDLEALAQRLQAWVPRRPLPVRTEAQRRAVPTDAQPPA